MCCNFDLAGHRLYVSTGELAVLTATTPPGRSTNGSRRCPYQVGPRCAARARRPLGCRTFFCDPGLTEPCQTVYEAHHAELRRLHERHRIPYAYVELVAAIQQCGYEHACFAYLPGGSFFG